ncbi:LysE family translocator [Aureimonas sp. ME7]|uniref:LysE family translocator n=1 Tax=Aureimonas sp. ME7 TaxID=2744252 RepID=UPI0015F6E021|nr:LysE family translocator [Aureimonas sp. ME7]
MTFAAFLAYSLALGVAAAIPGPGVVALVARTLGSGFRHGVAFSIGLTLGDLTYLAAACFGLAVLAEAFGEVFVVIRYGASLYLAYLAWKLWRSAVDLSRIEAERSSRLGSSFSAGYLITLSNPKTIVFYLALLPTIVPIDRIHLTDFAVLAGLTTLVLLVIMTAYAGIAARARDALRRPSILTRIHRGAATVLAATAAWTLLRNA